MSKVDELKVYTGKETIEALLEGKILENRSATQYKISDGKLLSDYRDDRGWVNSCLEFNKLLRFNLTEVATPQVGDWVRVTMEDGKILKGLLVDVDSGGAMAKWNNDIARSFISFCFEKRDWQILSPEEVSEYKREQAFAKVGRKLNEFKANDIVYIEAVNRTAIVVSSNNETEIRLHSINVGEAGHTAKPHQLTPVCFVDHMVDLS
ncbi:hypothetical protein [Bacillus cereus]|uniref:hypothetical protein n=2 Tax=Bacillus TaxID=1386 RepID=UPI0011A2FC55|nr:hypothetical protein [Bacillus cereus]